MRVSTGSLSFKNLKEADLIFVEAWLNRFESDLVDDVRDCYYKETSVLQLNGFGLDEGMYPLLTTLSRDLRDVELIAKHAAGNQTCVFYTFLNGDLVQREYGQ